MWIIGHLSRCDGYVGLIGFDLGDRDQRQANVAHFLKQAMQRGLVEDRARDDVVPSLSLVRLSPSNQAAHRPARCPLRADFVSSSLVTIAS